jgi:dihydroflavonol-4-reductase
MRSDRADEVRDALRPHLEGGGLERLRFATLDLTRDDGWDAALKGHDILVHTASPFPIVQPKDAEALVRPAVDGTRRALEAAVAAGIGRVVLTSSTVAIIGGVPETREATEADWTDPDAATTTPYERSKTLAEKAAWEIAGARGLALTTIHPSLVFGPPLDRHYGSSVALVKRMLMGKDPMVPRLGTRVVDVRDVAEMHLRAAEMPQTAGKRYLASAESLWFGEMTKILKAAYPQRRIATRIAPDLMIRLLSLFDPSLKAAVAGLGRKRPVSNARARDEMGMTFIPGAEALRAAAAALVAMGEV